MWVNSDFIRGETVFLKTDKDKNPYIVIAISVYIDNSIKYTIANNGYRFSVFGEEIDRKAPMVF